MRHICTVFKMIVKLFLISLIINQNVSIIPVSSQNFAKRNPVKIFTENCEYEFQANGACTVEYIGPFRPGNTKGRLDFCLRLFMFSYMILYSQIFRKLLSQNRGISGTKLFWMARGMSKLFWTLVNIKCLFLNYVVVVLI